MSASHTGPTLECPPSTEADDAMDKIVGKLDCSIGKAMTRQDAMDLILINEQQAHLDVETHHTTKDNSGKCVNKVSSSLDVETLQFHTTPCMVNLRRIESILFDDEPLPPAPPVLGPGEHFTRSKLKPRPPRTSRRPRTVSTAVNYTEPLLSDEDKPLLKPAATPQSSGPSRTRVAAQNQKTVHPDQRLPPVKGTSKDVDTEDTFEQEFVLPLPARKTRIKNSDPKPPTKGVVKMKEYKLKKSKPDRKYNCRMCMQTVKSASELLLHHQKKHGIIYCKFCQKAFNNQLSLSRHEYEHTLQRKYKCKLCKDSFPFQSQLTYHMRTHRKRRSFFCVFPKCGRKFKNRGDLNRHACTHTKKIFKCPDCKYTNPDKWNFESH